MKAAELNKLPLKHRRKIMREQAEPLIDHYAKLAEEEFPEKPVFSNCNVCGRQLSEKPEFEMRMCLICADE